MIVKSWSWFFLFYFILRANMCLSFVLAENKFAVGSGAKTICLSYYEQEADDCLDAEVIYAFLEANGIGKTHFDFYISYGLHLESKNKIKTANQILELGISRVCTISGTFFATGRDKIVRNIEKKIADFTFIPVDAGREVFR
ncbi:Mitotic spindle checkpoint protein [Arachis hypogaea]|nr:Mitotic spindle checkpoint protein [Arachis hypogaea]